VLSVRWRGRRRKGKEEERREHRFMRRDSIDSFKRLLTSDGDIQQLCVCVVQTDLFE
jgi:hypothetical protein